MMQYKIYDKGEMKCGNLYRKFHDNTPSPHTHTHKILEEMKENNCQTMKYWKKMLLIIYLYIIYQYNKMKKYRKKLHWTNRPTVRNRQRPRPYLYILCHCECECVCVCVCVCVCLNKMLFVN